MCVKRCTARRVACLSLFNYYFYNSFRARPDNNLYNTIIIIVSKLIARFHSFVKIWTYLLQRDKAAKLLKSWIWYEVSATKGRKVFLALCGSFLVDIIHSSHFWAVWLCQFGIFRRTYANEKFVKKIKATSFSNSISFYV